MKVIAAVTVTSLFLLALYCLPVMGVKEEPEEDMLTHGLPSNVMRTQVRELLALLSPEDLLPVCSNIATFYDRLLKRGPTFNAWGGKRTLPLALSRQLGKRNPNSNFNPWGGKRGDTDDYIMSRSIKNYQVDLGKPNFLPWGGR